MKTPRVDCITTRIHVQARTSRKAFDTDLSPSLDPRDPDILRAKAIPRSVPQASVPSALDRKEV
jgi:hypothetical protein